jgi:hypothetical protein
MTEILVAQALEKPVVAATATPTAPKKYSIEELKQVADYFALLGQGIYPLVRAAKGLPPEDDLTYGLIDRSNPRETGMLTQEALDTHVAWDVAASKWPVLRMFDVIRQSDLSYQKTLEGKNWILTAALLGKREQTQGPASQINIGTPQWGNPNWGPQTVDANGQPQQQGGPPKKKHFWSRS